MSKSYKDKRNQFRTDDEGSNKRPVVKQKRDTNKFNGLVRNVRNRPVEELIDDEDWEDYDDYR